MIVFILGRISGVEFAVLLSVVSTSDLVMTILKNS